MFLLAAFAAFAVTGTAHAKSSSKSFYLTQTSFTGSQATTACATGYHMASIWEIVDPSNLTYNKTLGLTQDDTGFGPPSSVIGWVRTGDVPLGDRNCAGWTTSEYYYRGLTVYLNSAFDLTPSSLGPWIGLLRTCDTGDAGVWCVSD